MKSASFCVVLDAAAVLERVVVEKWNSFGTVADRTILLGGGSETKRDTRE